MLPFASVATTTPWWECEWRVATPRRWNISPCFRCLFSVSKCFLLNCDFAISTRDDSQWANHLLQDWKFRRIISSHNWMWKIYRSSAGTWRFLIEPPFMVYLRIENSIIQSQSPPRISRLSSLFSTLSSTCCHYHILGTARYIYLLLLYYHHWFLSSFCIYVDVETMSRWRL